MDMEQSQPEPRKKYLDSVIAMCVNELKANVKGAAPRSDFSVSLEGPNNDPLLGRTYGMSVWASFALDDLDSDTIAYRTYHPEGGR